ncbi:SRPBCC family protein [Paenibacillus sp. N4]|uniref:SRPBCC family protein n=1 Tax=Paenibacillus vietnamensis TaxID=2590547 RepID=UPI001CD05E8D|nr:SRPBCC family protein [Paenibacillus vietnamensis]MCA0757358.1 SRPBCC family protein [Paenibacillus vietnamensis]
MENFVPVVKAEMLIKRPAHEVYEAFVDPAVTTKFWFTKSSGRLEADKRVRWEWEMYGVSDEVHVLELEEDRRIVLKWSDGTKTEWSFTEQSEDETFVTITYSGFGGSVEELVLQATDNMGGYTIVLCGLKALLEHGVVLNLVADKAPYAHVKR